MATTGAKQAKEEKRFNLPKLEKAREARELSRSDLAKKAKVTTYAVWAAEKGDGVTAEEAGKIARVIGVQVASLR